LTTFWMSLSVNVVWGHLSEGSLVRRVTCPKGHLSEGSPVRRVICPKGHLSEGSPVDSKASSVERGWRRGPFTESPRTPEERGPRRVTCDEVRIEGERLFGPIVALVLTCGIDDYDDGGRRGWMKTLDVDLVVSAVHSRTGNPGSNLSPNV
jgi:hypothetical protein